MDKKNIKIFSAYCLLFCTGTASANINPLAKLQSLCENDFKVFAYMTETSSLKVNEGSNFNKNNLSSISQQQVSYSLSAIENMQLNNGSGLYFRQTKTTYNTMNDESKDIQKYNNTFSGKFNIDGETSFMATINESKNSVEQITLFNGEIDDADTKSIGITLAYNKKLNKDHHMFAFVGKNWIDNDLNSLKKINGEQMNIGMGLNYLTLDDKLKVIPQVNIQKYKSNLQHLDGEMDSSSYTEQTTATIGVKTNYRYNSKLAFGASINYEKDIDMKNDFNNIDVNKENLIAEERYGVALSMVYQPENKMNFIMDYKHKINSKGSDNTFNVGVRYKF